MTSLPTSLRPAMKKDISRMATVMAQASTARRGGPRPDTGGSADIEYLQERLNRPGSWAAVVLVDNRIAGFVAGNPVRDSGQPSSDREDLGLIMVAPVYWGHGIARQLLDWAANFHRSNGKHYLELWTQASNQRARSLYELSGYTLTGETKVREGEQMVRYRLVL